MSTDAPGLKRKRNRDGSARFYWEARSDLAKRGYRPSSIRLHFPDTPEGQLQMAARCRILQAEMLAWQANDGAHAAPGYDGTVTSLSRRFQTGEESPYAGMKWNTRHNVTKYLAIIERTVGSRQIGKLLGPDFKRWHRNWGAPAEEGRDPRPWRAKHLMDTVRQVIAYGVTEGFEDCIRADTILSKIRFPVPPARKSKMTVAHVDAFRPVAHDMGLGSLALATVLQFELSMRQKDIIGEWEPAPDTSGGIVYKGRRWTTGLTWADIDADMILRKATSKTGAHVEHDLMLYPAIVEEIARIPRERRVGPVIISEATGEPYKNRTFTQTWRRVADKAGIPSNVWNMDARSGAISEAYDAGAVETDVMKHAGHKNRQTSARYNRGSLDQTRRVAHLRMAKRTGNKS
jgi:hypothetical protein